MKKKPKICPECGQKDEVVPIAYGLPGEKMIKDVEDGKIVLGGCVIEDGQPRWFCKRDKYSFQ